MNRPLGIALAVALAVATFGNERWLPHLYVGAEDVVLEPLFENLLTKEGSANSLAPEFRLIKSMEVEDSHTLTVRFDKPSVVFGNKVNQGLFSSVAFIQSIVYEAVDNHWRATPHFKRLVFLKVPEAAAMAPGPGDAPARGVTTADA